jgi:tetratricopeptide (TPR) repeat protein
MGLIAAATFILATQTAPKGERAVAVTVPPSIQQGVSPSKARLDEIWDHIDNRFVTQSDIWFEEGEFPSCVALLKVQSAYQPDDYEMMTNLGWMLENIEKIDEARAVYLDFGKRHPEIGDAMYALGFSYFNKKEYAKSIEVLEPTLAHNPSQNTYRTIARAYELLNKPNDAIRVWELELTKFPNEASAKANIARVKAKLAGGGK